MNLPQLTFTRFLAAISIVIIHFGLFTWPFNTEALAPIFNKALAAVSYFFVLSGFILVISSSKDGQLAENIPVGKFWINRIARIAPIYLCSICVYFVFHFHYNSDIPLKWQIQPFIYTLFFLQAWKYPVAMDINYPAWSISVEMFFYALFPFIYKYVRTLRTRNILFLAGFSWLVNAFLLRTMVVYEAPHNLAFYFPPFHLATFLSGVAAGIIFIRHHSWIKNNNTLIWSITLGTSACLLFMAFEDFSFWKYYQNGLLAPYFILILFSLSILKGKVARALSSKPLTFLGDISYSTYLIQVPVLELLRAYIPYFSNKEVNEFFFLYLSILIVTSAITYLFIEKPARLLIRKLATFGDLKIKPVTGKEKRNSVPDTNEISTSSTPNATFMGRLFGNVEIQKFNIQLSGHLILITYLIFCIIFYLERIIPWDTSFYLFRTMAEDSPDVEHGRWGGAITELLPYFLFKLNCGLNTIVMSYSISFALVYYLFWIIITYVFKNTKLGWAYAAATVMLLGYNFFFTMSEIHTAMGILFLYTGLLHSDYINKPNNNTQWYLSLASLCGIAMWLSNTHILSIIPFAFVNAHYILFVQKIKHKVVWAAILISFFFFIWVILSFEKGSFQSDRIITIKDLFMTLGGKSPTGVRLMIDDFRTNYLLFDALVVGALLYLIYLRKYFQAVLLFGALAGLALIIMTYNRYGGNPVLDRNYNVIFAVILFVAFYREGFLFRNKWIFNILTVLILFTSFYRVVKYSTVLTDRIATLNRYINNLRSFEERKFVVTNSNFRTANMWGTWNITFESLFLSSLYHKDSALTFCVLPSDLHDFDSTLLKEPNALYSVDFAPGWFDVESLPKDYFTISPRTSYKRVNSLQDSTFVDSIFTAQNVKIKIPTLEVQLKRHKDRVIPISVMNLSSKILRSEMTAQTQFYLSYHLYDEDGKIVTMNGPRTPLEIDIEPGDTINTGLLIETSYLRRGLYKVEVDMLVENKRWLGINQTFELRVF
ncbi:MAG: acyltransferase [Cytophagaceae bacterium]|jgi:peptidoglycan/LPS O-acetylase OafA/YrhL|nr:acyltransferase [Cytophagaceae bacterium]